MTKFDSTDDVIDAINDVSMGWKFDDGSILMTRNESRGILILYDPTATKELVLGGLPQAAQYLRDEVLPNVPSQSHAEAARYLKDGQTTGDIH